MPVYDYRCRKCHKEFEAFNYIDDRQLQKCIKCGSVCEIIFTTPPAVHDLGWEPIWDNQLGRVVRSRKDRERAAKEIGLTNVGDATFEEVEREANYNKQRKERESLEEKPSEKFLEAYRKAQALYPNTDG